MFAKFHDETDTETGFRLITHPSFPLPNPSTPLRMRMTGRGIKGGGSAIIF
jgi:hypothetical protein